MLYQLYKQLQSLFLYYQKKDFFKDKLDITSIEIPEEANHKAMFEIKFMPFPIYKWDRHDITEVNIFDAIEFLFHHVSKPYELGWFISDSGYNYQDYVGYDNFMGKVEFRSSVNIVIRDYGEGFELSEHGEVLIIGKKWIRRNNRYGHCLLRSREC